MIKAVIFDLDDTLYPERDYVFSGFRAVAKWAEEHLGIPCHQGLGELCHLFNLGIRGDTFNRWLQSHGQDPDDWVPQMVRVYREHAPQLKPYPEILELLLRLRRRYRLGLLSDGYLEVQKRKLAALGLASYFDAIVFSDEWGRDTWKPHYLPFRIILGKMGISGPEAVYVADNPAKDFLGARRMGIWTIRVRRPDGLYCHLEPPSAEYASNFELESLNGLEEVLE
ncbi:MAG: HAD family hydrolase, partial [Anaerolineae bacterium]